jgi:pimeloyl-ACP methyl ester carboxylesterase
VTHTVGVSGGRSLTVESSGAPEGLPIFLLHGTPGSRSGPKPRSSVLYRLGVRLISYDRPGYGLSDRHEGRSIADAATDVLAIAEDLQLGEFGVVGRSGGGPHALACVALLGERVRSAAVLVGLAPRDASDLCWYDGMAEANVIEYTVASHGRAEEMTSLREQAERVRADPESLFEPLTPHLTGPDRRVVNDVTIRAQLAEAYSEALRDSAYGWIDDVLALAQPWGFDPATITQPVLLWHGADDVMSPVGHAYWLADKISTSVIEVASGVSHFGAVETLPRALAWVKAHSLRTAADPTCAATGARR